jgi:hypothetical protein
MTGSVRSCVIALFSSFQVQSALAFFSVVDPMLDAMEYKVGVFRQQAFWDRLGPSQGSSLFVEHTDQASFPILLSCAHSLMEDMCGSERVNFDDSQTNESVRAAIIRRFGGEALSLEDKYFSIALSGSYIGVGLGPNAKKRTQTAKLALAIRISAATMQQFKP